MNQPIRIFYAAGPGDVIGTYRHWKQGVPDPSQIAETYSGQFFDVCREFNAEAIVFAWPGEPAQLVEEGIRIEHRPQNFGKARGLTYQILVFFYGLMMIRAARSFRVDMIVVSGGIPLYLLWIAYLRGIMIVPTLHCTLWPARKRLSRRRRFFSRLGRGIFKRCFAVIGFPYAVRSQVEELTGGKHSAYLEFLPHYHASTFDSVPAPRTAGPFNVLFVGRIEEEKGVLQLLAIAAQIRVMRPDLQVVFDLCGDGSDLPRLRKLVIDVGLTRSFRLHGHCERPELLQRYGESHVIIAPTTVNFVEGFNKVVVEAVLAGRPVITSSVCPALQAVSACAVEVAPNHTEGYRDAILDLATNPQRYEDLRAATATLSQQFTDPAYCWASVFRKVMQAAKDRVAPAPFTIADAHSYPAHRTTAR